MVLTLEVGNSTECFARQMAFALFRQVIVPLSFTQAALKVKSPGKTTRGKQIGLIQKFETSKTWFYFQLPYINLPPRPALVHRIWVRIIKVCRPRIGCCHGNDRSHRAPH